jgi:hypothetical protein
MAALNEAHSVKGNVGATSLVDEACASTAEWVSRLQKEQNGTMTHTNTADNSAIRGLTTHAFV